jgi:hypothetical protein
VGLSIRTNQVTIIEIRLVDTQDVKQGLD